MNFPAELKYTKEHEWLRIDGEVGWIGITDFAQSELGDIVFVELPAVGTKLEQGKAFGTIEAVKAVSDLYAPVRGEVVEINKEVQDSPELVNKEPYERGWLIKLKMSNASEVGKLLDVDSYKKLTAK